MKKLNLLILMLTLLIVSCTNNVQQSNYTDNNEEKSPEGNIDEENVPANEELESYFIYYDNMSVTENLPNDLGIYKVEDVFDYDEESDTYYKDLDFGWNTAYIAENITADISDDESKLYTKFELINLWFDVEGDPVPTAIAECEITY